MGESSNNSSLKCFTMDKRHSAPRPLKHAGTPRESKSEELAKLGSPTGKLGSPMGVSSLGGSPKSRDVVQVVAPIVEEREVEFEEPKPLRAQGTDDMGIAGRD